MSIVMPNQGTAHGMVLLKRVAKALESTGREWGTIPERQFTNLDELFARRVNNTPFQPIAEILSEIEYGTNLERIGEVVQCFHIPKLWDQGCLWERAEADRILAKRMASTEHGDSISDFTLSCILYELANCVAS